MVLLGENSRKRIIYISYIKNGYFMYNTFIKAINEKIIIQVTFNSKEKGEIIRTCIPFDFGPSRKYKDGLNRYHYYDLDSPDGKHNLALLPEQVVEIALMEKKFNPGDYVTWAPNWLVARDWGVYS